MFLGRYNLDAQAERGAVARDVKSIHVHPEWKVNSEKWDADLAVLVLTEAVSFTQYIQPVCVPASAAIDHYDEGTVVSYRDRTQRDRTVINKLETHLRWDGEKAKAKKFMKIFPDKFL